MQRITQNFRSRYQFLGAEGTGKTLLLKKLQNHSVTETTIPIETVGTNLVEIPPHNTLQRKSKRFDKKDEVSIREVGGSMAPLWPSYYGPSITGIIFLIDACNLFQVSISTVMLMEILSHEKLRHARILIILSKMDITDTRKVNYLKFMMRLDRIVEEASDKRVTVKQVSTLTGDGVESVRDWIFTCCVVKPQKVLFRRP